MFNISIKKLFLIIFIFFSFFIYYFLNNLQVKLKNTELSNITNKYVKAYETIYEEKKTLTKYLVSGLSSIAKLDDRLFQVKNASLEEKNAIREAINNDLKDRYRKLQQLGVRQVHIHLPNNESFLRLHKPELYGDNLTGIRPTVEYVNKYKMPIDTLEEGRVYYGYRFVYPIFKDKEHVGSIEISFGAENITKSIMSQYNVFSNFFFKASVTKNKGFDNIKTIYKPSHHEGYNYDINVLKELEKVSSKNIKQLKPSKEFTSKLREMAQEKNATSIFNENIDAVFTVIPIFNKLTNENIAFLTIRSFPDYIIQFSKYHNLFIALNILLIALILIIIFLFVSKNEKEINLKMTIEREKIKFQALLENATDGIHIIDNKGNLILFSNSFANMLGYQKDELQKSNISDWDVGIENSELLKKVNELIDTNGEFTTKHKRKDGSIIYVTITAKGIEIDGNRYLYASSRDTSLKIKYEKELLHAHDNLKNLLDLQNNIVIVTNEKEITFANKKFFEFFGLENLDKFEEHYKSNCIAELFIRNDRFFHLDKLENSSQWLNYLKMLIQSKRVVLLADKSLKTYAFSLTLNDFDNNTTIISFTDISETMTEQIDLENRVIHDKLTDAYNREYFEVNYKLIIKEFTNTSSKLAIAFLDIDHFKNVNDTFGHDVGDEVLKTFVNILKKFSRRDDILIRWGGEEFIMLLKITSKEDLEDAIEHLRKVVEIHTFTKVGKITCSIGATIYQNEEDIESTLKRADEAVYNAKANGRNKTVII